jgi:hypothetical protein
VPYDLGDTVRLVGLCRNAAGDLADAATKTLTLTLPDGTTTAPSVPAPSPTGTYTVDYTTVQAGRHLVRWTWTTPDAAYTDAFDVREATPPLIVSLADAKAHLNITVATHDEELRGFIESATSVVEFFAGPVVRRTVSEVHGGGPLLALSKTPAISLTSVAALLDGGASYTVADLDLDGSTGIVRRKNGSTFTGPLRISYVVGRAIVPAPITHAARELIKHFWRTQLGSQFTSRASSRDADDYSEPIPGLGYSIPNRVIELLQPFRRAPEVG